MAHGVARARITHLPTCPPRSGRRNRGRRRTSAAAAPSSAPPAEGSEARQATMSFHRMSSHGTSSRECRRASSSPHLRQAGHRRRAVPARTPRISRASFASKIPRRRPPGEGVDERAASSSAGATTRGSPQRLPRRSAVAPTSPPRPPRLAVPGRRSSGALVRSTPRPILVPRSGSPAPSGFPSDRASASLPRGRRTGTSRVPCQTYTVKKMTPRTHAFHLPSRRLAKIYIGISTSSENSLIPILSDFDFDTSWRPALRGHRGAPSPISVSSDFHRINEQRPPCRRRRIQRSAHLPLGRPNPRPGEQRTETAFLRGLSAYVYTATYSVSAFGCARFVVRRGRRASGA